MERFMSRVLKIFGLVWVPIGWPGRYEYLDLVTGMSPEAKKTIIEMNKERLKNYEE